MWFFNQPSASARTALVYITIGALTVIWTGVWYVYLHNNPPERVTVFYWCYGFMITGFTLILIGLGLGQIGRSAQRADLPPQPVPHPTDVEPTHVVPAATAAPVAITGQVPGAATNIQR